MSTTTHEAEIAMTIEFSSGIYRIWDTGHKIPRPSDGVSQVLIKINGTYEKMFYNKVWGASAARDPKLQEGTWLKQKSSTTFRPSSDVFRVKYSVST